ncbi:hypothetical protein M2161_006118 [Streptomyces sp. SAI-133]|nr:hypothetical protein [Streptomyces sp. SAI-133]
MRRAPLQSPSLAVPRRPSSAVRPGDRGLPPAGPGCLRVFRRPVGGCCCPVGRGVVGLASGTASVAVPRRPFGRGIAVFLPPGREPQGFPSAGQGAPSPRRPGSRRPPADRPFSRRPPFSRPAVEPLRPQPWCRWPHARPGSIRPPVGRPGSRCRPVGRGVADHPCRGHPPLGHPAAKAPRRPAAQPRHHARPPSHPLLTPLLPPLPRVNVSASAPVPSGSCGSGRRGRRRGCRRRASRPGWPGR